MSRKGRYLFTSESVTEGHPDKIADQISDAILDAILAQDPTARVACETLVTTGLALVAGEITTRCYVDFQKIVRETIKEVGYTDSSYGFDAETCAVLSSIHGQSPDIAMGVDPGGAGDQRHRARPGQRPGVRVLLQRRRAGRAPTRPAIRAGATALDRGDAARPDGDLVRAPGRGADRGDLVAGAAAGRRPDAPVQRDTGVEPGHDPGMVSPPDAITGLEPDQPAAGRDASPALGE